MIRPIDSLVQLINNNTTSITSFPELFVEIAVFHCSCTCLRQRMFCEMFPHTPHCSLLLWIPLVWPAPSPSPLLSCSLSCITLYPMLLCLVFYTGLLHVFVPILLPAFCLLCLILSHPFCLESSPPFTLCLIPLLLCLVLCVHSLSLPPPPSSFSLCFGPPFCPVPPLHFLTDSVRVWEVQQRMPCPPKVCSLSMSSSPPDFAPQREEA